jgi:hypothetical protein
MKAVFVLIGLLLFLGEMKAQEKHPLFHNDTIQQHKTDSMNKEKKKRADSIQDKEKKTRVDTSFGKPTKRKKDSINQQPIPPPKKMISTFFCMPGENEMLRLVLLIMREAGPDEIQGFVDIAELDYYSGE